MSNLNYIKYKFLKPFKSWKNKYLKSLAKKDALRRDLYNQAAKEISEYTGEPIETVKHKNNMGPESEKLFSIFKERANPPKENVEDFYKSCSYYLYELPLWNAERSRPKYLSLICLPYLRRNKYKKVMDFGAGAGDLCIELAKNSLEAAYCDIGECLFNFAQWRFAKRNLPIKMVNGLDSLRTEGFDCIFSFDAFEHIKDLPAVVKKLSLCLKENGSLIFSGAFSGGALHLEENEKYNEFKNLDELMRRHGLAFQDKFAQYYFYKRR
jgi:2-polyprenyl-3-methyl-5-hydroxy-6-metoxy-1,4-benzoquinol methylase